MTLRDVFEAEMMGSLGAQELLFAQEYLLAMRRGVVPRWWCDFVAQGRSPALADAVVASRLEAELGAGIFRALRFHVGSEPQPDVEREANEALLRQALPDCEIAVGGYDNDGTVAFPEPARGRLFSVVLEIGTTRSATTASHLAFKGGLARWPYGHTELYVLFRPLEPRKQLPSGPASVTVESAWDTAELVGR